MEEITRFINTQVPINIVYKNVVMAFRHKVCKFFQTLGVWSRKNCEHFSAFQKDTEFQHTRIWWRPVLVGKT